MGAELEEKKEDWREGVVIVCWWILGGEGSTKKIDDEDEPA